MSSTAPRTGKLGRSKPSLAEDSTPIVLMMDGASEYRTFFQVMLPLSIPGFVVAGIFQFTNIWNDFLFGLIVTSQQTWPVTVRLNNLLGDTSVDYGTLMAGALMVAAPTVLVYLILGRYFIGGLTAGSVK